MSWLKDWKIYRATWGLVPLFVVVSVLWQSQVTAFAAIPLSEPFSAPLGRDAPSQPNSLLASLWEAGWRIAAFVGLWAALYAPFILLAARTGAFEQKGAQTSPQTRLYLEATGTATILASAWIMTHFADRRPFVTLGFSPNSLIQDTAIGGAVGVGMVLFTVGTLWWGGWLQPREDSVNVPVLPLAALNVWLNSITQEVLVRGYILQTLQAYFGASAALLLSSGLFSVLHFGPGRGAILPTLNYFLAGLLLGAAYLATDNLWAPIALHFVWNFLLGTVFGLLGDNSPLNYGWRLFDLKDPAWISGKGFANSVEGGLIATLASILGIAALYLIYGSKIFGP